jgi:hypothetical protein
VIPICVSADFFIGPLFFTRVFPGASLGHGFTSTVDKVMSFLWALWLMVGPSVATMEQFLLDVRSFTTDFGVESLMSDVKNLFDHFAQSVGQRASAQFAAYTHLFPNSSFLPDWNHNSMNLVKRVLNSLDRWPSILARLRSLCEFFKIWEYRSCLRQSVISLGRFDLADILRNFTASFAHWRYETVHLVFTALQKLRNFCENFFDETCLGNVAEAALVANVRDACRDKSLWRFPCRLYYILLNQSHVVRYAL